MRHHFKQRPRLAWTVAGSLVGVLIGAIVGDFGIAARGSATGFYGWAVGAALFGYIGFRFGEWRDRKKPQIL